MKVIRFVSWPIGFLMGLAAGFLLASRAAPGIRVGFPVFCVLAYAAALAVRKMRGAGVPAVRADDTAVDRRRALYADRGLSPREQEAAELLIAGKMRKEISEDLGLSPHTVDGYIKSIYRKFAVNSVVALVNKLT